ncbi:metallophosphoesterase [Clostridium botulinum]|uniref:metallophosphoesterase n=1 Tax=Clostridium botulinum TaxID=1491 RepID=UPI0004D90DFE|nr:metallophosphoesterase [Clostridium botulinum]KEH99862.1 Ser/Thr protein phosphatase family protein [Clostridium botulinum C/D str. BKT75002]KEI05341.1 Ser/Thr protein phosphatase family protein [Clostridium botulinum C/D str. BKT2873]QPW62028.1 metallophosphoesterase [Clostridium botulinum]
MLDNKIKKQDNETIRQYEARLYRNKVAYGLNNKKIWKMMNEIEGKNLGESTRRCRSFDYNLGRQDTLIELNKKYDKNVMIINDLHVPYERKDALEIIQKHSHEIDTLVIAGDLMDCEAISSFPKVQRMSLVQELIYAYNFLKKVRRILNNGQKIVLFNGNHEERLYKEICNMQKKDLQKFLNPNILSMLVDGFTIYEDDKKVTYEGIADITYIPHWYVNLDEKLIVCHPKGFSQIDGRLCESVVAHFLNKQEKFDVAVFGHTHKQSQMIVSRRQGVFAVENGCMCNPMKYADCGKLNYTKQDYCYTIIRYNNDEKVNYNNIKTYYLDELKENNKKEDYILIL